MSRACYTTTTSSSSWVGELEVAETWSDMCSSECPNIFVWMPIQLLFRYPNTSATNHSMMCLPCTVMVESANCRASESLCETLRSSFRMFCVRGSQLGPLGIQIFDINSDNAFVKTGGCRLHVPWVQWSIGPTASTVGLNAAPVDGCADIATAWSRSSSPGNMSRYVCLLRPRRVHAIIIVQYSYCIISVR